MQAIEVPDGHDSVFGDGPGGLARGDDLHGREMTAA
jgi:hypothetical protein